MGCNAESPVYRPRVSHRRCDGPSTRSSGTYASLATKSSSGRLPRMPIYPTAAQISGYMMAAVMTQRRESWKRRAQPLIMIDSSILSHQESIGGFRTLIFYFCSSRWTCLDAMTRLSAVSTPSMARPVAIALRPQPRCFLLNLPINISSIS